MPDTIEQLAREIERTASFMPYTGRNGIGFEAARLALLEGERRERERCAGWLEQQDDMSDLAQTLARNCEMPDVDLSWTFKFIADAIRSAK